jgi:hypothetical protein
MCLAALPELVRQADEVPAIVGDEDPAQPCGTTELIDVGESPWR